MLASRLGDLGDRVSGLPGRPLRVCVIAHTYYDEDPRVRRETEALITAGHTADVFALRRPGDVPASTMGGVRVLRLPIRRHQGGGLLTYLGEYLLFLARAGFSSWRAHREKRYSLVHVHSLPDFLVFAALPVRLGGVPVILDLHEATAEFFRTRFPAVHNRFILWLVRLQERLAIAFADQLITATHSYAERLRALGVPARKITVVLNTPALELFDRTSHPARPFMSDGQLRLVYAGALTPTYELDVVLEAVGLLREWKPDLVVTLDVYGRGDSSPALERQAAALRLSERVRMHGRIALESVPAAIAAADVGLAPTRRDRFTELTVSTKVFEYAALGKPVVASRLRTLERYFPPGTVWTYESGDAGDLARALQQLINDPAERSQRIARTARGLEELTWTRESRRYLELVERVAARRRYAGGTDTITTSLPAPGGQGRTAEEA